MKINLLSGGGDLFAMEALMKVLYLKLTYWDVVAD